MIDCKSSIITSLLYLFRLVDGLTFTYSPNPTVGQTLIVTWSNDTSDSVLFRLGLQNVELNTAPQQIQTVEVANGQTTGTVSFTPTETGYVYNYIQHSKLTINKRLLDGRELWNSDFLGMSYC